MYHYLDKPLNHASSSEKFFIWAVRGWLEAMHSKKCPRHFLRSGFAGRGSQNLYPAFNVFMNILYTHPARDIRICSLSCSKIAEDEALILAALSGLENKNTVPATIVFKDLIASPSVGKAHTMATRLVSELSKAGVSFNSKNACPENTPKRPH